jgi:hypothetical protein
MNSTAFKGAITGPFDEAHVIVLVSVESFGTAMIALLLRMENDEWSASTGMCHFEPVLARWRLLVGILYSHFFSLPN